MDAKRERDPHWFQQERMMGAVCYVDRFVAEYEPGKALAGLYERLDYLKELGVTYLHLMPLFKSPPVNNDGGYAVSSFRDVSPDIGTMAELAELARTLREQGISLVLDFVFNHTADDHTWAKRALDAHDPEQQRYQAFYRMFPDRTLPDAYERHLRPIFPAQRPGSFTYNETLQQWVWTTFFSFQWDLNYANPDVFRAMLEEMLFLANQGVEVLRLDAVPFIWKQLGTTCENLPEAHLLIQAFNVLVRVAAPALVFKSEAIVHPRDVQSYISEQECQISYNPILMVSLWGAIATRDVRLLTHTMQKRFMLPPSAAWVNYLRSHDDIGWGFADEDAAELGINADDYRWYLNLFYTGREPRSFAAGEPFQFQVDPRSHQPDMRISGTLASLLGLEKALKDGTHTEIEHAIRRIVLVQGVIIAVGGIPLLYLGDEIGTLNDYGYKQEPAHRDDSRWLHRPRMNWQKASMRTDPSSIEGQVFHRLVQLIKLRQSLPEMANGDTSFYTTQSSSVFAFSRRQSLVCLCNFSETLQTVSPTAFVPFLADAARVQDQITGSDYDSRSITLQPYEMLWLRRL
ncbi:MAG: alpha-amylase family protein [Chloroflexota bacterium]|nr:alpha-amylase family protein [Chloroflexota bacterium]